MATPFRSSWRPRLGYWSTAPLSGESSDYIFRGQNLIMRGGSSQSYMELWKGLGTALLNDSIDFLISGTLSKVEGSTVVTGSGGQLDFIRDLKYGDKLLVKLTGTAFTIISVARIISSTQMLITSAEGSFTNGIPSFARQIQEVDTVRAAFIAGSIILLPRGHLIGVGALTGITLDEARVPVLSFPDYWFLETTPTLLYVSPIGNQVFPLGMRTPTTVSAAAVSGGTKNMQPGRYSIRIVPARIATDGFNNPSPTAEVTLTTAGQMIQVTFPSMNIDNGQDAWRVYGTLYSTQEAVTGPWYHAITLTTREVGSGGGTYAIEWRDAEIAANDVLAFDNDPPPNASFITTLGGIPLLLGCNGKGHATGLVGQVTSGNPDVSVPQGSRSLLHSGDIIYLNNQLFRITALGWGTGIMTVTPTPTFTQANVPIILAEDKPGPVIRPAQPFVGGYNIEAFPARLAVALNPPENVIGYVEGVGRIYLLTANRLHIVTLTGNPDFPITVRPFWKTGFSNPRACTFINGYLYGFTTNGATRSAGAGDTVEEEHAFASPVQEEMRRWDAALVFVAYDQKNEAVVYFYSNAGINKAGYRYSVALMYMLRTGVWSTPIRIEDPAKDMIVTSAATIAGKLYILAAKVRVPEADLRIYTYEWDAIDITQPPALISGYAAMPFRDEGAEDLDKNIHGLNIIGYSSTPFEANIYGAGSEMSIPVSALEQKAPSNSGAISYVAGPVARVSQRKKLNVQRVKNYAVRIDIQAPASVTNPGRIDEIVVDGNITQHKY